MPKVLLLVCAGVVNGIDYNEWNPATDPHLQSDGYTNYDLETMVKGKAQCKAALQKVWQNVACFLQMAVTTPVTNPCSHTGACTHLPAPHRTHIRARAGAFARPLKQVPCRGIMTNALLMLSLLAGAGAFA